MQTDKKAVTGERERALKESEKRERRGQARTFLIALAVVLAVLLLTVAVQFLSALVFMSH